MWACTVSRLGEVIFGRGSALREKTALLFTTTEAIADSSPWVFMAETRYCAVSSKSHLTEESVT